MSGLRTYQCGLCSLRPPILNFSYVPAFLIILGFLASEFHFFSFDCASSTAKLIAAIMLSGFAIPLPAISNAVP